MRASLRKPLGLMVAFTCWTPSVVSAQVLERGRTLTQQLLKGEAASLLPILSPELARAVGGAEGLNSMAAKLKQQAGAETRVIGEHAFRESGFTSYYRVSQFEKAPSLTTRWAWDSSGKVIVANIKATPQPADTPYADYATKTVLRLPLGPPSEGLWYVAWGGRDATHNKHVVAPDQRFAYDFLVMQDGNHKRGAGDRNEDHFCFGAPVVAPAGGRVVVASDGAPDNSRPGLQDGPGGPGNHVVIDHGGDEYSFLAHFRLNSVRVRPGQTVKPGDVLGACGNSGKSELPHVHYHLQNSPTYEKGLGLPAPFNGYFVAGRLVENGEPRRGDLVQTATAGTAPSGALQTSR